MCICVYKLHMFIYMPGAFHTKRTKNEAFMDRARNPHSNLSSASSYVCIFYKSNDLSIPCFTHTHTHNGNNDGM